MTDGTPVSGPPTADEAPRGVAPTDIFQRFPSDKPKAKTFLEYWGITFMFLLLLAIILVTMIFLVGWLWTRPTPSEVATILGQVDANDPAGAADRIDTLSTLCQNHLDNYRDLFQVLVLGGLVPLFTLIAGYVFGRNLAERRQQEEAESEDQ